MEATTAQPVHASGDPTAGYAAILGSPIACLILLIVAVRHMKQQLDAALAAKEAAWKAASDASDKREADCVARVRALEQRHVDYIEGKADKMTEALLLAARAVESSVAASNNLAAVVERNSTITDRLSTTNERLTEAYRKTPFHD